MIHVQGYKKSLKCLESKENYAQFKMLCSLFHHWLTLLCNKVNIYLNKKIHLRGILGGGGLF